MVVEIKISREKFARFGNEDFRRLNKEETFTMNPAAYAVGGPSNTIIDGNFGKTDTTLSDSEPVMTFRFHKLSTLREVMRFDIYHSNLEGSLTLIAQIETTTPTSCHNQQLVRDLPPLNHAR